MAGMSSEGTGHVEFRAATPADAAALAALHLLSWRATYDPLLEAADRARLTLAERRAAWERRLADDPWGVWLAERGGRLVGFVSADPALDDDLDPVRIAEVTSLHVTPELHGHGLGHRLLARAEEQTAQRRLRGGRALGAGREFDRPATSTSASAGASRGCRCAARWAGRPGYRSWMRCATDARSEGPRPAPPAPRASAPPRRRCCSGRGRGAPRRHAPPAPGVP